MSNLVLDDGTIVKILPDGRMNLTNVAIYLGISRGYIYKILKGGLGPVHYKMLGRTFIYKKDLDEWIEMHKSSSKMMYGQMKIKERKQKEGI